MKYHTRCHCGAVEATVEAANHIEAIYCDCSICEKTGGLHLLVSADQFELLSNPDAMSCYTFNSGIAQHYFCKTCGVKPFYVPRSHPDGYSVNARCLEPQPASMTVANFDGKNWELNIDSIRHLARPNNAE